MSLQPNQHTPPYIHSSIAFSINASFFRAALLPVSVRRERVRKKGKGSERLKHAVTHARIHASWQAREKRDRQRARVEETRQKHESIDSNHLEQSLARTNISWKGAGRRTELRKDISAEKNGRNWTDGLLR
mmetsp:Transcript_13625/g.27077  ORF Transcript_13625/g.27077 Transcript_13625/m.27077 type:complete len:131 (+) Transcript_13625:935-1327(+)